ncbi:DUF2232 domain-containing protein [Romboutsia weinsteinii]|uniref:DUF2232 domain-containing protein n=1 Tax=Romboutsia weinsteinii TaxID=2020949 RepID=A0A371J295_9FIRM|nr:DUF2232 domain-containing protein [Romboutsia weinsteinii]RDY26786.1 DUF2232 domain-containing protein [Romboutsia weinsteinii]
MSTTKKLTEASLLSSLFIVTTIIAVGTGLGYGIYLDFIVPIFFCVVCLKCELKYTVLSGVSSLIIIFLVLGNIGAAIWSSQSIVLGIVCGYLLSRDSTIIDDLVYGSIIGIMLMVFVDIYASAIIGYSFMKEFQGYANMFPFKEYAEIVYYLFIAVFPLGMFFSIYSLSLFVGKKLDILRGNTKKKLYVISNFRNYGRFVCCSKKVFYICVTWIILVDLLKLIQIHIDNTYINTIVISSQYICYYFVIKDSFSTIQNYIFSKYNKVLYVRILSIIILILLMIIFKITTMILVSISVLLDKKINIRVKQMNIVSSYADTFAKR